MSSDRDPLLRAVRDGDTACPDGKALAALGDQVRKAFALPREVDLVPAVLERLDQPTADIDVDDEAIDRFYDGGDGPVSEELAQLAALIRHGTALPEPVDLERQVRARLSGGSLRLTTRRAADAGGRFRIWSAVIAGHVAALLAIATWHQHRVETPQAESPTSVAMTSQGVQGRVGSRDLVPPRTWESLRKDDVQPFASRATAEVRDRARAASGLTETAPLVRGALDWLADQQDATGHFGLVSGQPARDLATQALACLALLGEGLDGPGHAEAARAGLRWIAEQNTVAADGVTNGLVALALTEGAALIDDADLRAAALRACERPLADQPGPSGLGGFGWVALEIAATHDLAVSGHLRAGAERNLGLPLPSDDRDAGRIGLAAFARLSTGRSALASTPQLLSLLSQAHLRPRIDAAGRVDALGLVFPTWAMQQAGDPPWSAWTKDLTAVLPGVYSRLGDLAWVPAERVRFADAVPNGDVFATAVTTLLLQSPYRCIR